MNPSQCMNRLTLTELEQLRAYVDWTERRGSYYGYKERFDKRHEKIKQVILDEIANRRNKETLLDK